ncbi:ABC transporter ATP-binding protein [Polycladidibacter stylochi]|uniref:ABC transporter ATP-binding protein n=1 Tax=Polycladidibacter stylochi TaxID=1807766 RepID=UPI00082E0D9E|nr:ABC transporter ATP-binding protein [Pseudovibrio stylochi]
MATLTINNAGKKYGSVEVLNDISMELNDGELVVLLGSSGCGKSTLLNMIAGLESISSGDIRIDGEIVNDIHPKNRDIAMVFQSYALYPNMTVAKNISFGLEMRGVEKEKRDELVNSVAKMLQIDHLLNRKPAQLSGGQRQRVAMGRALVRRPKIFLFDEPLSNLDAKLRVEMRHEIKKLHTSLKATMVYVTHDQIEAMTLADRIAILKGGVVQQFATPAEIYSRPANMFVAGFVGSPSMNFLPVTVAQQGNEIGVHLAVQYQGKSENQFVPMRNNDKLSQLLGREVILGIRPEMITQLENAEKDLATLHCDVEVVEPTGADTLCIIKLAGKDSIARVSPIHACAPGESMGFALDISRACLFDPVTEELIS